MIFSSRARMSGSCSMRFVRVAGRFASITRYKDGVAVRALEGDEERRGLRVALQASARSGGTATFDGGS